MPTLILSLDERPLRSLILGEPVFGVGRHADNSLQIHSPDIADWQARIVGGKGPKVLEDLAGRGNTYLNGQPLHTPTPLRHGDRISLNRYHLTYHCDESDAPPIAPASTQSTPYLQILNGPHAGRQLWIDKPRFSLGKAGGTVLTIVRDPHGHLIQHTAGDPSAYCNGQALGKTPHRLVNGDQLHVAGIELRWHQPGFGE